MVASLKAEQEEASWAELLKQGAVLVLPLGAVLEEVTMSVVMILAHLGLDQGPFAVQEEVEAGLHFQQGLEVAVGEGHLRIIDEVYL